MLFLCPMENNFYGILQRFSYPYCLLLGTSAFNSLAWAMLSPNHHWPMPVLPSTFSNEFSLLLARSILRQVSFQYNWKTAVKESITRQMPTFPLSSEEEQLFFFENYQTQTKYNSLCPPKFGGHVGFLNYFIFKNLSFYHTAYLSEWHCH